MSTVFSQVAIGGADRRDDVIRVELWRTVSSVGNWMAILRNTNGVYNGVFDVQDQFLIDVNALGATLMQGRVDGPEAVTLRGRDLESDWDEYAIIRGVDQAQDLLFHNDFEQLYPNTAQFLHQVWNDVINIQLAGATNITYVPPGVSPAVGAVEFREGTSFLATTQELFRRAGFIFYVDDVLAFQSGAPGFSASAQILTSVAGGAGNNILDIVDLTERDGDKHYNYVRLYGKNPMFDGYTEQNAASWTFTPLGQGLDDVANVMVGGYSQVVYNNNPCNTNLDHTLTCPIFNYTTWDFNKGEIGIWGYYDNNAGAPGTPGAGGAPASYMVECSLRDNLGQIARYYGQSTLLYRDNWGYCSFPLGERFQSGVANVQDQWCLLLGAFDWGNVDQISFMIPRSGIGANFPSHFYIDSITIPEPCISVVQNAGAQAIYRRRPYIDYFQHIRTQNALDEKAAQLLTQHESTLIDKVKLVTEGNIALRYAGQSVTVNVPALGLNNAVMYMTQIHHIIEPYSDVSDGFGFDWITEVEAIPTSGVGYDMSRLRLGSVYSPTQVGSRIGTGVSNK